MIESKKIQSVEIAGMGRFYKSPTADLWYPSVTTVTGWSKRSFFAEWRKDPNNAKKLDLAGKRGTAMHEMVESYLQGEDVQGDDPETKLLFLNLQPYLDKITNIRAQEKSLCSDTLRMAGRFDCIADYDGVYSVIDFKSSDKPKKEDWIQNYFEQAAAYSLMWYEETRQRVDKMIILISCQDGTVQVFDKDPSLYYSPLRNSVANYWNENQFEKVQERIREHLQETARAD